MEQGKFFIINKIENSHIEGVFSASNLPSVLAEYNPVSTLGEMSYIVCKQERQKIL